MDMATSNYRQLKNRAEAAGQGQLFAFWGELDEPQQGELLADVARMDFDLVESLVESHVLREPPEPALGSVEPVEPFSAASAWRDTSGYRDAIEEGVARIKANNVAALLVAGGQGTRLGYSGPKGMFQISPLRNKSLFRLFAEFIRSTCHRYRCRIPWYIMTSPANDAETRTYFSKHDYFGLDRADVFFFQQGVMPAFSTDGKILLDRKHRVALSPDGHGGTLLALARSGALQDMSNRGIDIISYFQVDNPLCKPIDPLFIGLHHRERSEMSTKVVSKADDFERVGNFARVDGKVCVVEYSDLPDHLAVAKNDDGSRVFNAGNIAVHILDRPFVERLTGDKGQLHLPWHRAAKKVPFVDPATSRRVEPDKPNAVKLEAFIFDAIPLAQNPLVLEVARGEEFSPVKNAAGVDSPDTARDHMSKRAAAWIESCGATVPRKPDGSPDGVFEISPLLALDAEHLGEVWSPPESIASGASLYLPGPDE